MLEDTKIEKDNAEQRLRVNESGSKKEKKDFEVLIFHLK